MSEKLVAVMQFSLTVLFTLGFFLTLGLVTLGRAHIPAELVRIADTLFGGLIAILTQQSAYWFARQRGQTNLPEEK